MTFLARLFGGNRAQQLVDAAEASVQRGDLATAEAQLAEALARTADQPRWHARLGTLRHGRGDVAGALECYRRAWALDPTYAEMPYNIGISEEALGHLDAAIAAYRSAIEQRPDFLEAWFNLATLCTQVDRFEDAIDAWRRVLALDPDHDEARVMLASTLQEVRRLDDAERELDVVLARRPDHPGAHLCLGLGRLARGDLATGWAHFEWRWRTPTMATHRRQLPVPEWNGEDPAGLVILVHHEQGFGDSLQFARFVPLLAARGAHVRVEVPRALIRLFRSLPGVEILEPGQPLGALDRHVPMMSLARYFAPTTDAIPSAPYLHAPADDISRWRNLLAADRNLKVGLAWAGDPRPDLPEATRIDRRRSIALRDLAPLAGVDGVSWYSLQLGAGAAQAGLPDNRFRLIDHTAQLRDFADTAAFMAALDLVITVDTSVVHVAGATGRPTWLLSRFDGCWRWLLEGETSPWYPSVRVFRQTAHGTWTPVVAELVSALRRAVELHAQPGAAPAENNAHASATGASSQP